MLFRHKLSTVMAVVDEGISTATQLMLGTSAGSKAVPPPFQQAVLKLANRIALPV
jgi:hypothetical protein